MHVPKPKHKCSLSFSIMNHFISSVTGTDTSFQFGLRMDSDRIPPDSFNSAENIPGEMRAEMKHHRPARN